MQDLFVDRLGNVILGNNVARLDFLRLESVDSEKQQLALRPSTRLVIPLEGLLQAIQMLERLRDQINTQTGSTAPTTPPATKQPVVKPPAAQAKKK
jgi:hypothetical protein